MCIGIDNCVIKKQHWKKSDAHKWICTSIFSGIFEHTSVKSLQQ